MTLGARLAGNSTMRLGVALAAIAAILLVGGGWVLGERYVSVAPGFCTRCHQEGRATAAPLTPGHAAVICQQCHAGSGRPGLGLLLRSAITSTSGVSAHGALERAACTSCHERQEGWQAVADTSGHRRHFTPAGRTECVDCHAKSLHSQQPPETACVRCHDPAKLHAKIPQAETCLSCHNFALRKPGMPSPGIDACTRCHDAKAARMPPSLPGTPPTGSSKAGEALLHGSVECKLCHQPHRTLRKSAELVAASVSSSTGPPETDHPPPDGGPERSSVTRQPCHRCHEIRLSEGWQNSPPGHVVCSQCHREHMPLDEARQSCQRCHEQARSRDGERSQALRHDSCASCHIPHDWKAERGGCMTCHELQAERVFTLSPEPHRQCVRCHELHGPLPDGKTCASCHKDKAFHVASAPPRHKNCASCHDPHRASNPDRQICGSCHAAAVQQVVTQGPARHGKDGCLGCHRVHGAPAVSSEACKKCHTDKSKAAGAPAKHRICVSCHQPHAFSVASVEATCKGCHAATVASGGAHAGPCNKCHDPHGSPGVSRAACVGCHEQIKLKPPPGSTKHADCGSCHKPHQAAGPATQQCAACHTDKASVARHWPSGSPHAGACADCHERHDVLNTKACGSCHANEAAAARGRAHQCKQCHPPHQTPAQGAGWWDRCASCHATQLAAAKAGGRHSDCQKCHSAHAFAPPSCASCHAATLRAGAHQVKEHQKCQACHDTHAASLPKPAQCLSCHQDRKGHYPDAKRCQACHPFK